MYITPKGICPLQCPKYKGKIFVYPSAVAIYHAPSDLSGVGGMYRERICSTSSWRNGPERCDCVYVVHSQDQQGFHDMAPDEVGASLGAIVVSFQATPLLPLTCSCRSGFRPHFSLTWDKHLHVIVEAPPTRKSFSTSQTISLMLFRGPGYQRCRRREERSDPCLA
jgi:hypothetical protein